MPKYKIEKQFIFSRKSDKEIMLFLDEYEGQLNLAEVKDQKNNTALHQCAFFNQPKLLEKYINYMEGYLIRASVQNPTLIMDHFLNQKNVDGITAMHYAAFKGHYKILEILQKRGANIYAQTEGGQKLLHLAAQGDKVQTFIYFQYSLDMNSRDNKMTTPLHWASFQNNQAVVTYLLAQDHVEINCQNTNQQTPLHFAADYGNTRILKRLLKAGADRTIKNKDGKTALDIAKENQFRNIIKLLDNNHSCLDKIKLCLNIKTDYRLHKKTLSKPIIFILILLAYLGIRLLFFQSKYNFILYSEIGLYSVNLLLYVTLLFPASKMKPKTYTYFLNTNPNIPLKKVCLICINQKPIRSVHCDICRNCISRYDHHCYWINNCVGRYNHNRFLLFIVFFLGLLLYLAFIGGCMIYNQWLNQDEPFIIQLKPQFDYQIIAYTYGVLSIGIFLALCIPIILLICVQTKNIFLNKTTYQRFTRDKVSSFTESTSHIIEEQIEKNIRKKKKKSWSVLNAKKMLCEEDNETEVSARAINRSSLSLKDSLVAEYP